MTTSELRKKLDSTCDLLLEKLTVRVKCIDSKVAYGRIIYKVIPINGHGFQWVDSQRTSNWNIE